MRKFVTIFCVSLLFAVSVVKSEAMNFEDAISQSKPCAVYLYADWADNADKGLLAFKQMEKRYEKKYNFVTLNLADNDAKAFNKRYHIYPNLPYVLLFRDGTKFSRYLNTDCVLNDSCFSQKLDFFVN